MLLSKRVSIVVPMYNCGRYIDQCLKSVSHQQWPDLEVILVDDGSTDDTIPICRRFIADDSRFSLVTLSENQGPANARNAGMAAAGGDYLFFLDADDWLAPCAVEKLVQARETSGADLVVCAYARVMKGAQAGVKVGHFDTYRLLSLGAICDYAIDYMREPGKYMMFSHCWGRLFIRRLITENNICFTPGQRICEDVLFNFEYLRHARSAAYVDMVGYYHRFGRQNSAAMAFILHDGRPLLFFRDIWLAYAGILSFIRKFSEHRNLKQAENITRLGHISHAIVLLVRACGGSMGLPLMKLVHKMVRDPTVRQNLEFYHPLKGQSRLIPFLLRQQLVVPLILWCKYKNWKRYGKIRLQA